MLSERRKGGEKGRGERKKKIWENEKDGGISSSADRNRFFVRKSL